MPLSGNAMIKGFVAPGFEPVADAFQANFDDGHEVGAAFAVFHRGKPVVDLWGGVADIRTGRPWCENTIQMIFSGTKGLVAGVMLLLLDRGLIDLDLPVSRYWPEFGKPDILIRHILSHSARLPGLEAPVTARDLTDDVRMAALLAAQLPSADPRAAHCYHPLTYGWLCGEVVRRVCGRSIGQVFASEFAAPLNLDLWIGLPEAEEARVAQLVLAPDWGTSDFLKPAIWASDPLVRSVWGNPDHFSRTAFVWNDPPWHAAEIPGINAIGSARSMARFYGWLAEGGAPAFSRNAANLARTPLAELTDDVTGGKCRYGVGFELQNETLPYGPPAGAFGHSGAGGSNHGAWPEEKIGYSYAMNKLHDNASGDRRAARLLSALDRTVRS